MNKKYITTGTLELINYAQKSIGFSYVEGKSDVDDSIVAQSICVLEEYATAKVKVSDYDMPHMKELAGNLLRVLHGEKYRQVLAWYQQLKKEAKRVEAEKEKFADFAAVVSVLNNKKQAQAMSMENLTQAHNTIASDKIHAAKLKQRSMQQLQSYALTKYAEAKTNYDKNFEPYQKFVEAFNLSHQKNSRDVQKTKTMLPAKEKSKAQQRSNVSQFEKCGKIIAYAKKTVTGKWNIFKQRLKKAYYRYEPYIAVSAIALTGILGIKAIKSIPDDPNQLFAQTTQPIPTNPFAQQSNNTIHFTEAQKNMVKQNTTVAQDYYDTSLQIHLGSKEKVQRLYNKIDSLAAAGKIKFSDGLNTKRYAHAFTMYNLIRPNSAENKIIKNLLAGGKENPDLINRLVLKAKAKGEGIKPDNNSIKTSNFDKAGKGLQIQHLKNLQMQR